MKSVKEWQQWCILRVFLGFLIALQTVTWSPAVAAPKADAAISLVEDLGRDVLEILETQQPDKKRFDQLTALLDRSIDFDLIGRLVLGKRWRDTSATQQSDYQQLFRAYALENLVSKLDEYDGHGFEVSSAQPTGKHDALVQTHVLGSGSSPLSVDWRIREREDGRLVAIDVIVEGVSMIVTLRSEFAAVIERSGMDGLLETLRQHHDLLT